MTTWNDLLRPGDATDFFARGGTAMAPFEPAAEGYCVANARWLAELSRIVYRHDAEEKSPPPEPTRTSFLELAGLRSAQFFQSGDTHTQALLVVRHVPSPFAVLVFRGTEQHVKDFVSDLWVAKAPVGTGAGAVHGGFQRALNSVWTSINDALTNLECPVFFTGHSLGAALATLAAARRTPRAVYTFGSPRVGDAAFATSLATVRHYRVVDDKDVVTTVPPEWLGYAHTGEEKGLTESSSSAFGWLRRLVRLEPIKSLADHAPINYVDRIGASTAI